MGMNKVKPAVTIDYQVRVRYRDGSEDVLGNFYSYEDAENYILTTDYLGDMWIRKVYSR